MSGFDPTVIVVFNAHGWAAQFSFISPKTKLKSENQQAFLSWFGRPQAKNNTHCCPFDSGRVHVHLKGLWKRRCVLC